MWEWLKQIFAKFLDWLEKNKDQLPKPPEAKPVEPPKEDDAVVLPVKFGQTGPSVKIIQDQLKELGYDLEVDSEFGEETQGAVLAFQEANKIGKTGVVGEQTYAAMFSGTAKGPVKVTAVAQRAAKIALEEAKRNLHYTGPNSEAEKYLKAVRSLIGMPSGRFAWCAAFVFWCFLQAGLDLSEQLGGYAAYVPGYVNWAKKKGYWHPASEKSFNPREGDMIIFDWSDTGDADHIGLVVSYDGSAYVNTAEGNTSSASDGNGDQTSVRRRHWDTILGFIRVA